MVTKSKLKMALAAEKGVDYKKQNQKKRAKEAEKRKQEKGGVTASDDEDDQIQGEYEEIEIEEAGSTEDDEGDEQEDDSEDEKEAVRNTQYSYREIRSLLTPVTSSSTSRR